MALRCQFRFSQTSGPLAGFVDQPELGKIQTIKELLCVKCGLIYLPRGAGRLSQPGLLHTEIVYPPTVGYPNTNRGRCRLTTLIEANVLTTTLCSSLTRSRQGP